MSLQGKSTHLQLQPNTAELSRQRFTLQMDHNPKQSPTHKVSQGKDILCFLSHLTSEHVFQLLNTKLEAERPKTRSN